MPFYAYRCPDGHITEKLASRDAEVQVCSCGAAARRESVYRVGMSGFAPTPVGQQDFHNDYRRYMEASGELDYKVSRREQEVGHTISVPLYQTAKKEAERLHALGVTADDIST